MTPARAGALSFLAAFAMVASFQWVAPALLVVAALRAWARRCRRRPGAIARMQERKRRKEWARLYQLDQMYRCALARRGLPDTAQNRRRIRWQTK